MDLFHFGWRDSLSINKPEFWCISIRAPLAFIGPSNAISMASENHFTAPAAFREPPPAKQAQPGNGRSCRSKVFISHSGYRTRYPFIEADIWYRTGYQKAWRRAAPRILLRVDPQKQIHGFPAAMGRQQANGEAVNELFPRWFAAVVHVAIDLMDRSPQKRGRP